MSDPAIVSEVPVGANPFLEDDALCDVLSRLGFDPCHTRLLVSWWEWMDPCEFTPDDLASALMLALPCESRAAAEKRRSMVRMGVIPEAFRFRPRSKR